MGSEMCIRDSHYSIFNANRAYAFDDCLHGMEWGDDHIGEPSAVWTNDQGRLCEDLELLVHRTITIKLNHIITRKIRYQRFSNLLNERTDDRQDKIKVNVLVKVQIY